MATDDLRIKKVHPLITPAVLQDELPVPDDVATFVTASRKTVNDILTGNDSRLLVIVGPCSIHDIDAALEYARRLAEVAGEVEDAIYVVMRVYFEKPRTTVGWKGLLYDPDLDGTHHINKGLRLARQLLLTLGGQQMPCATEFLDNTFGQYYTDLVTWGAIGARTVESQIHRQMASGLSMPVGIKNRTDGDVGVAIDAIMAAQHGHLFPTLTKEGAPAIMETRGNPDCHVVLRGGKAPNFEAAEISEAIELCEKAGVNPAIVVDCSHANSGKDPERQPDIARTVVGLREQMTQIKGLMIESHLTGGSQVMSDNLTYGQSITDACLGFADTRTLLHALAKTIRNAGP